MWIAILVFLMIVVPIVLSHDAGLRKSHRDYSNGIMNHDASFREFYYRVDKSRDEIWSALKFHISHTPMKYRFNEADGTIVFYSELPDGSLDITYDISVFQQEGYSILKVVQQNHFWKKNKYAHFQNEFWYSVVDAQPIPHVQVGTHL